MNHFKCYQDQRRCHLERDLSVCVMLIKVFLLKIFSHKMHKDSKVINIQRKRNIDTRVPELTTESTAYIGRFREDVYLNVRPPFGRKRINFLHFWSFCCMEKIGKSRLCHILFIEKFLDLPKMSKNAKSFSRSREDNS